MTARTLLPVLELWPYGAWLWVACGDEHAELVRVLDDDLSPEAPPVDATTYSTDTKPPRFGVWINAGALEATPGAIAGTAAHEAVHVVDLLLEAIGEEDLTTEVAAYLVDSVTEWIVTNFDPATRPHRRKTPSSRRSR